MKYWLTHVRSKVHPLEALALLAIVAIAVWTRLGLVGVIEFKSDEAKAMLLAAGIFEQGAWPLLGMPAAGGAMNPPLYIYLVAVPLAFGRDALMAAGWVGLLNVVAVLVTVVLVWRHFGLPEALVAGLLYATSYWAAYYSRKVWQPSFLPFFTAFFALALFDFARGIGRWRLAWAIAWLGLAIQVHLSAVVLAPLLGLAVVLRRRTIRVAELLAGLVAPGIALIPYLIWEVGHGFANTRAMLFMPGTGAPVDLERLRFPLLLISGLEAHAITGDRFQEFLAAGPDFGPVFHLAEWLFAGGLVYFFIRIIRALRGRDYREAIVPALVLSWAIIPIPFYLRFSQPFYPHYVLALYPLQYVTIGAFVGAIGRWLVHHQGGGLGVSPKNTLKGTLNRPAAVGMILLASVIITIAVGSLWTFQRALNWIDTVDSGFFGLPLNRQIATAEAVRREIQQVVARSSGDSNALQIEANGSLSESLGFLLGRQVPFSAVDADQALVLPSGKGIGGSSLYILSTSDRSAAGRQLVQLYSSGVQLTVAYPGERDALRLYRLSAGSRDQLLDRPEWTRTTLRWENGVRLLGFQFDRGVTAGSIITPSILWSTGDESRRDTLAPYRFFVHVLDGEDRSVAGGDLLPYPVAEWGQDDLVLSWHPISVARLVPDGWDRLVIGMYDLRDLRRIPLADARTQAELGPLRVRPAEPVTMPKSAVRPSKPAVMTSGIELLGYELTKAGPRDSTAQLRLYWSTSRNISDDLTVFVHFTGIDGKPAVQHDGRPAGGRYPTKTWKPNELVVDDHPITFPASAAGVDFRVLVGMYQARSGRREQLAGGSDAIDLGLVRLEQP